MSAGGPGGDPRRVLVTGVAGGIGAAIAGAFRADGWTVLGMDRVAPDDATADLLAGFAEVDLADPQAAADAAADLAGVRLDALVNNAAVQPEGTVLEASVADWEAALRVNVIAPALLVRALHPALTAPAPTEPAPTEPATRSGTAAVVNVSSVHALATTAGRVAYGTSKAALAGLTRSLALELAPEVRVNAVLPGAVDTPMLAAGLDLAGLSIDQLTARVPLARIATPAEVARTVLFLADGAASGYVTGQSLVVDGGVLVQLSSE